MKKTIYLDNAATTKISDEVFSAMEPYLKDEYGNAGSLHKIGRTAYNAVANARKQVASLINAEPSQIIFTSGGSEANNMAFYREDGRSNKVALVSAVEHDSVLGASDRYYNRVLIPVSYNGISISNLEKLLREHRNLVHIVSVMYTNNETGIRNPVKVVSEMCHREDVLFHTDCVQAVGYEKIDVNKIRCDFLSLSSHKIHGPKGVGALFVKNTDKLPAFIKGGNTQEFGKRGGTENVAGIVGFGKACELAEKHFDANVYYIDTLVKAFSNTLIACLCERNRLDKFFHVNGEYDGTKILNLRFDGIPNETLLMMLDANGVCVSAGSACTASDHKASHVLTAMGYTEEQTNNSIRVSFSTMNSIDEVINAARIIANCVQRIHEQL